MTKDKQQSARPETVGPASLAGPSPALDADRVFLLECRLEQLRGALGEARAEADLARSRLAEVAAREAEQVRREALVREELAQAREEVTSLHRRLEQSEALRAELEGHLFEAGSREDAEELIRLRRELLAARQRAEAGERTLQHLRGRVEDLLATRETLLTRVVEWQRLVRRGDAEAVDLGEFIASLRGDILELEHRNAMVERREAELRQQLERAGADLGLGRTSAAARAQVATPEAAAAPAAAETTHAVQAVAEEAAAPVLAEAVPAADAVEDPEPARDEPAGAAAEAPARPASAAHAEADELGAAWASPTTPDERVTLLLKLGRSGDEGAYDVISRGTAAGDARVRAAAYEALGRLHEGEPSRLEPHLRAGLADPDARVRRRVALVAATARGLDVRGLLEPLRSDGDPQVRRVVHQILGRAALDAAASHERAAAPPAGGSGLRAAATSSGGAS